MHDVETVMRNLIEILEVTLADGWCGWVAVRAAGKARVEGKEYVMQDGDVVEFRFNV